MRERSYAEISYKAKFPYNNSCSTTLHFLYVCHIHIFNNNTLIYMPERNNDRMERERKKQVYL